MNIFMDSLKSAYKLSNFQESCLVFDLFKYQTYIRLDVH